MTQVVRPAPEELESLVDTTDVVPPSPLRRALGVAGRGWLFIFLLLLLAFFWAGTPSGTFLSWGNISQIGVSTSEVMLLAIGQTFVIVTAGIDLSIGGILFFSGVCGGEVMLALSGTHDQVVNNGVYPHQALAIPVGIAVALGAGTVCGLANGLVITRLKMPPFIVTLGMMGVTFGIGEVIDGGSYLPAPVPTKLTEGFGAGKLLGLNDPIWVALVFLVLAWVAFRFTRFGRYTCAVGSNDEGTRRAGIAVDWHVVKVYTLAGFLAGVAAVVDLAIYTNTTAVSHRQDNLAAISAVVLGGTSLFGGIGSILMSGVGAFVPTVLQNGLVIEDVQPFWQEVAVGATIILAVYIDQLRRRRTNSS